MIHPKQLLTVLQLVLCLFASAGVNIKNGNFYISYSDHDLTRFNGMDIVRTYNSKSSEKGLFGIGWGSEIETRLYIIGDGHILIKEFGTGRANQFSPVELNEAQITQCINQLVQAALQKEDIENNPASINQFRRKMRNNLDARFEKWMLYTENGLLKNVVIAEQSTWKSQDLGYQHLFKIKTGFKRIMEDNSYDLFNNSGLFTGRYNSDGRLVYSITYNASNRMSQLKDKGGNTFLFTTDTNGRIVTIKSREGTSYYWYKGLTLVKTKDVANNTYRYDYDSSYNMIAINYSNGTSMRMEYDPNTLYCIKVTLPNGNANAYEYKTFYDAEGNINSSHYATLVLSMVKGNIKTDSAYYEYELRDKADGSTYLYHFIYKTNTEEFEELANEKCGMPVYLIKNKLKYSFTYNNNCQPVSKESDSLLIKAEIDSLWNKASRLSVTDKRTGITTEKQFVYNKNGNPSQITEDSVTTTISYSDSRKVTRIVQGKTELLYQYNRFDQLISVTLTGTGILLFVYDKEGALLRKESQKGKTITDIIETVYNRLEKYIAETGIQF